MCKIIDLGILLWTLVASVLHIAGVDSFAEWPIIAGPLTWSCFSVFIWSWIIVIIFNGVLVTLFCIIEQFRKGLIK